MEQAARVERRRLKEHTNVMRRERRVRSQGGGEGGSDNENVVNTAQEEKQGEQSGWRWNMSIEMRAYDWLDWHNSQCSRKELSERLLDEVELVRWREDKQLEGDDVAGLWFCPALRSAVDAWEESTDVRVDVWLEQCVMVHWPKQHAPQMVAHRSSGWLEYEASGTPAGKEQWEKWTGTTVHIARARGEGYDAESRGTMSSVQTTCRRAEEEAVEQVDRIRVSNRKATNGRALHS